MSEGTIIEMNNSEGFRPTDNLVAVCRLCLSVSDKLINLYRSDEIESSAITLSMKVSLCTSIRMSKQDLLPQKICQTCFNYVSEWYKFRKKCISNDIYLKRCFSNSSQETLQLEGEGKMKDFEGEGKMKDFEGEGKMQNFELPSPVNDNDLKLDMIIDSKLPSIINEPPEISETINLDMNLFNESKTNEVDDVTLSMNKPLLRAPTKKFLCPFCPDSFYYVKDLKLHKSVLHKEPKTAKPPIKEILPLKDDDIKLDEANARARYEMKCCEKVFFSKARFRKHFNKKHPGEKPYMCETCGKKDFISEETLKRHKVLHTGKYRCDICSKTFTCNAILIIHKRDKHENDKPFICDICGKRFVTELLMNYHKRFHTGEKKYVCEECGLAVVTSSSLAKHKRIHSNVKPHVCQICGKGFIIKGRLVEHLRIHTGERPYSCHICHKGFTMRDKLKRHIRIHSGEKLFSCEYCGNNYSTSYGLTVHLKSHVVRHY